MTDGARQDTVELAIIGGGLAGLSLALALAEQGERCPRTLILEARPHYKRDRTWSYWRVHGHAFESAVRASWTRCLVRGDGRSIHLDAGDTPYETVDADHVYALAQEKLRGHPRITLQLGTPIEALQETSDGVDIILADRTVTAKLCVDTRPPRWPAAQAAGHLPEGLVQAFAGYEIETEKPCFDPGEVVIMDFHPVTHADEMRFMYVLPYTPHRALVEDTRFTPVADVKPPLDDLSTVIEDYVGSPFTVHYTEVGCLPMISDLGKQPARPSGNILRAGTAGGALRPSSGYGFLAIQRQTRRLAGAMAQHGLVPGALQAALAPRPGWLTYLDRIFLRVLQRDISLAPHLFTRLFHRADTAQAIRFLADTGSPADALAVVRSMPKPPFLVAAALLASEMGRK